MDETVGARVKRIRENQVVDNKKMSQEAFGKSLGVSRSVIANIEYNKVEPSGAILRLICATYNINYGWLMSGKGEMNPPNEEKSIIGMIDDLLEDNETAKKVFRAFTEFSEEDWKTVQKFIDTLKK